MQWRFLCVAIILCAVPCQAYEYKRRARPEDVTQMAAADILRNVSAADRPFQRYIWLQHGTREEFGAVSYVLNTAVSHASVGMTPRVVCGGHAIRYDTRMWLPDAKSFANFIQLMENEYVDADPWFHADVVVAGELKKVKVPAYTHTDGKRYTMKWVRQEVRARDFALHCRTDATLLLAVQTRSKTPIVHSVHFLSMAMRQLDGGLYYQLRQVERNPTSGTAKQAYLSRFGADEEKAFAANTQERSAVLRSKITGKPRWGSFFFGTQTRPSVGIPLVTITHDITNAQRREADKNALRNLLSRFDGAQEVIVVNERGFLEAALFNDAGALQDFVPEDVGGDHTIPAPHTNQLEPIISCIRCHAPNEGFQPFPNIVQQMTKTLVQGKYRYNIFDDSDSELDPVETLDRLRSLWSGDLNNPLRQARDMHNRAVFMTTKGQRSKDVMTAVATFYNQYNYELVTPQTACFDLGYIVDEANAVDLFNKIVPPLPANRLGVRPEDPYIHALRSWLPDSPVGITREDWEEVLPDALQRVRTAALSRVVTQGGQR